MSDSVPRDESSDLSILIEQAVHGNLTAFEQLMLQTQHRVLMTARRILGNPADAEEATQEVFLRVYKYLHRFDRGKPFEPWLYRLTINVCNDIASRRPNVHDEVTDELIGHAEAPDNALDLDEQRRLIQKALTNLPAKQRSVLVLRDLQGLSVSEVAQTLEISEATVRSHLSAARWRLKRLIEKQMRSSR